MNVAFYLIWVLFCFALRPIFRLFKGLIKNETHLPGTPVEQKQKTKALKDFSDLTAA